MIIGALVIVIVLAALLFLGAHVGPHGSLVTAIVGVVVGVASLISLDLVASGSIPVIAWVLLGLIIVVSVALSVASFRMISKGRLLEEPASSAAMLIDKPGVALTEVAPIGTVSLGGETWTAQSLSGDPIPAGAQVFVDHVEGLRLIVISRESSETSRS